MAKQEDKATAPDPTPAPELKFVLLPGGAFAGTLRATEKDDKGRITVRPVSYQAVRSGSENVAIIDVLQQDSVRARACTPEEFVKLLKDCLAFRGGYIEPFSEYDAGAAKLRDLANQKAALEREIEANRLAKRNKRGAGPFAEPVHGGVTSSTNSAPAEG